MKYKDTSSAVVNGVYVGVSAGTKLVDALAPEDDGNDFVRETNHFGTIADDATDAGKPTPILLSLEITTPATKTAYLVADELDLEGLVVTGTHSGGMVAEVAITADNVTGFDSSEVAELQTLIITVDEITVTYDISISAS